MNHGMEHKPLTYRRKEPVQEGNLERKGPITYRRSEPVREREGHLERKGPITYRRKDANKREVSKEEVDKIKKLLANISQAPVLKRADMDQTLSVEVVRAIMCKMDLRTLGAMAQVDRLRNAIFRDKTFFEECIKPKLSPQEAKLFFMGRCAATITNDINMGVHKLALKGTTPDGIEYNVAFTFDEYKFATDIMDNDPERIMLRGTIVDRDDEDAVWEFYELNYGKAVAVVEGKATFKVPSNIGDDKYSFRAIYDVIDFTIFRCNTKWRSMLNEYGQNGYDSVTHEWWRCSVAVEGAISWQRGADRDSPGATELSAAIATSIRREYFEGAWGEQYDPNKELYPLAHTPGRTAELERLERKSKQRALLAEKYNYDPYDDYKGEDANRQRVQTYIKLIQEILEPLEKSLADQEKVDVDEEIDENMGSDIDEDTNENDPRYKAEKARLDKSQHEKRRMKKYRLDKCKRRVDEAKALIAQDRSNMPWFMIEKLAQDLRHMYAKLIDCM